jgi:hypothetical protein
MNIVFAPAAVGTRTGTLTITDNGSGFTQTVALTGTGTAVSLSTSSLAFGSQYVNVASAVQAVSITNMSSTTSFNVTAISVSRADYSLVTYSCIPKGATSGKLLPNATCAIYVRFDPTTPGAKPGTMSITTGGVGGTRSVTLSGTGVGGVAIELIPHAAAITDTATLLLTAKVTGNANTNVTWSVDGIANGSSSVGTIIVTGASTASYKPPTSDGSHTVTATSAASTTSSASMVVTVTDYPGTFTYHNDNARDGQNQQEIALTPSNVNVAQFGKLFSYPVDGQVYAQPLYVANVNIPGQGFHNVLYVATENDSVYAFDADGLTPTPLWKMPLGTPVPSTTVATFYDDLSPQIGITGTPVIDPITGTLFVVTETNDSGTVEQQLHALNMVTGVEQVPKVVINASVTCTDPTTNNPPPRLSIRCCKISAQPCCY